MGVLPPSDCPTNILTTTVNHRLDSPDNISMEQRLDPQQVKSVQSQILSVIQSTDSTHESNMQKEVRTLDYRIQLTDIV